MIYSFLGGDYLGNAKCFTYVHMGGLKWNLALEERLKDEKCLERYGYKVYSQNDEDGILHEIFQRIGIEYHIFVEFGVDKGIESNCHSLLLQGWHGIWI